MRGADFWKQLRLRSLHRVCVWVFVKFVITEYSISKMYQLLLEVIDIGTSTAWLLSASPHDLDMDPKSYQENLSITSRYLRTVSITDHLGNLGYSPWEYFLLDPTCRFICNFIKTCDHIVRKNKWSMRPYALIIQGSIMSILVFVYF